MDRSSVVRDAYAAARTGFFRATARDYEDATGQKPEDFMEYARYLAINSPEDFAFLKLLCEYKWRHAARNAFQAGKSAEKAERAAKV